MGFVFVPTLHATCMVRQIDNNALFIDLVQIWKKEKGAYP